MDKITIRPHPILQASTLSITRTYRSWITVGALGFPISLPVNPSGPRFAQPRYCHTIPVVPETPLIPLHSSFLNMSMLHEFPSHSPSDILLLTCEMPETPGSV
ncbi:hypothetical protein VKT23_013989 [Stygiomarasmius scandens]|uniref:Uncharacterized protein n=1 Tax=Marasmiellus scandens TaxID=2682957 RepID=A0ABR1J4H8_9AGAR